MKVYNYVVIILGLMVLLDFAGLLVYSVAGSTQTAGITSIFGFSRNIETNVLQFDPSFSAIANYLFSNIAEIGIGILVGLGLAGIAIGTFAKGNLENFIILPIITTTLVLFISAVKDVVDLTIVGGHFPAWIGYIVAFFGVVLVGGLMVSLWEHFRGTD